MSIDVEGRISVRLEIGADSVQRVDIVSDRPLKAAGLFEGRELDAVLEGVPLVFSVCAIAQGVAASRAAEKALGVEPDAAVEAARDLLLLAESAREHLWRVSIDWPRARGEAPAGELSLLGGLTGLFRAALFGDETPFALAPRPCVDDDRLTRAVAALEQWIGARILGAEPARWLAGDHRQWRTWLGGDSPAARHLVWLEGRGRASLGAVDSAFLPPLSDSELEHRLGAAAAADFIARPTWQDQCRETTVFTRQYRHPLVADTVTRHGPGLAARLVARLVELAAIPGRMVDLHQAAAGACRHTRYGAGPGIGIAQVEAARGRLVHRLQIAGGIVTGHRILAPTEWNFHPNGIAARGLVGLRGDADMLVDQARLWLGAVDPCVEFDIEVV